MARIREVIEYGNSTLIRLHKVDLVDLELKVGDLVDIEDIQKINKQNKKKK